MGGVTLFFHQLGAAKLVDLGLDLQDRDLVDQLPR
jgi:hypothetical protein